MERGSQKGECSALPPPLGNCSPSRSGGDKPCIPRSTAARAAAASGTGPTSAGTAAGWPWPRGARSGHKRCASPGQPRGPAPAARGRKDVGRGRGGRPGPGFAPLRACCRIPGAGGPRGPEGARGRRWPGTAPPRTGTGTARGPRLPGAPAAAAAGLSARAGGCRGSAGPGRRLPGSAGRARPPVRAGRPAAPEPARHEAQLLPAPQDLQPQLLGHPLPQQAPRRPHEAPGRPSEHGELRPGPAGGGVERAGLPAPEAEAAARLPRRALLPEVRSPPARSALPAACAPPGRLGGAGGAGERRPFASGLVATRRDSVRSGVIGSGLCVFSKHPIQEFTQHVYTLNGYPYMIHHGDWFCGKAVGLLVLHLSGLVLNAYVTHLHAEYNRQKDVYLTHRVAQAWELAQFIHHTSKKADVVLLCGDLNLHPKDLGCRLLKEWTGLHDAYHETRDFKGSEEGCTMVPENCYVSQRELEPFPFGIRIDYVLYKAVSGFYISCKTLRTTTGHDPHSGTPLSDHEALMATLCVRHSPPQHTPDPTQGPAERSRLISVLKEAWTELDLGVAQARWWATFAGYVIGLGLLLLALLCALAAGGGVREVAILLWTPSVGVLLGAGAVYLFHMQEAKGLSRARAELQHVLGRAREAQDLGLESQPALLLGQQERDGGEEQ